MPTRKQRRRQQKTRRHEYEYVYVDEEGNEVDVDEEEPRKSRSDSAAARSRDRRNGNRPAAKQRRPRRTPQPPSWRRAIKRAAMLGALFVVVFAFGLGGKHNSPASAVLIGLIYATAFVPLQYLIDRTAYRAFQRRQASAEKKS